MRRAASVARSVPRGPLFAIAAVAIALSFASGASERITLSTMRVALEDGVVEVPALKSSSLTITAFHFGPWIAEAGNPSGFGIVFRHVRFSEVRLGISIVEKPDNPTDTARWKRYLNTQSARLGPSSLVGESSSSSDRSDIPAILGWPTREADFTVPAAPGSVERIERHVVCAGEEAGVAFVLLGTPEGVAGVERDFRLLLARLTAR